MTLRYLMFVFVALQHLPDACTGPCDSSETYVFEEKCYVIYPNLLSWEQALVACQQDGGTLAMFNGIPSLTQFFRRTIVSLSFLASEKCMWIGVSDRTKEGDYRWVDGTMARPGLIEWTITDFLTNWMQDCGVACTDIIDIVYIHGILQAKQMSMADCDARLSFICQFETPRNKLVSTTSTATSEGLTINGSFSKPLSTNSIDMTSPSSVNSKMTSVRPQTTVSGMVKTTKRKEKPNSMDHHIYGKQQIIIQKMDVEKFVTTQPLWTKTVHTLTMCTRQCTSYELDQCNYVNYNRVTRACRAFKSVDTIDKVIKANWELWIVAR